MDRVAVQTADFDVGAETQWLRQQGGQIGALALFVGTVRDISHGESVYGIEIEHYSGMTERALEQIVSEARQRWSLIAVSVIHRVGTLLVNDQIVWVGVASRHRSDAFAACEFIMDYLKTRAPLWKKERGDAAEKWVEATVRDDEAAERWRGGAPPSDVR